jgi:2-(1,2-epoxy-1,2-dihydrophenyl)acetyl-CoA isomerase
VTTFETILFDVDGSIATLTLNRPEALNALTFQMMDEIAAALTLVEREQKIGALILTGAGRAFCSGQDLRNRPAQGSDIVTALMERYFPAMQAIRDCRVPVITAVNGTAAGAGCALALLGDVTVAAESVKFIQVFSRIGLVPDLGSTWLLPRLIGRARALQMMLSNEPVAASTALGWSMIDACVAQDELLPHAMQLAREFADQAGMDWRATRNVNGDRPQLDDG